MRFPAMCRIRMTAWCGGILLLAVSAGSFHCQSRKETKATIDRKPAVAGQFYPDDPDVLRGTLRAHFAKAEIRRPGGPPLALISPHAGYVFSGDVAASAFGQLDTGASFENIFLIGSSHHVAFGGASVYRQGNFITPLGTVPVNFILADSLISRHDVFHDRADAHTAEHSLEVQLPFLQYRLNKPFRIIPVVIGSGKTADLKKIAAALKPYFHPGNLFVISTDFSHYPAYNDANTADRATVEAILANHPDSLTATLNRHSEKSVKQLVTGLCGWSSVLTLLYMTQNEPADYRIIQYKNSGDSPYGEKNRVVGYAAIAVYGKEKQDMGEFILTEKDKKDLLHIARKTIEKFVTDQTKPELDESGYSAQLKTKCGAFVTLHKKKQLRGCIGRFGESDALYIIVREMAIAAATQDYRFPQVQASELKDIEIEISVLSPLKKIKSIDEFRLGKHGIWIKKGHRSGTFLPQVADETGWTKEEFLGHCARDKAGIGWDGWKDAELFTYEANVFSESELK